MLTGDKEREALVWGFIDAAGGIRSRCLLQDTVFLAQERGLVPLLFNFPVWPGIGTARYSEELEETLTGLLRSGKVLDTGGPATLKALERAPASAKEKAAVLARLLNERSETTLSVVAAYAMAQRRARERGVRDAADLQEAARIRLGWPESLLAAANRDLEAIAKAWG